jgi:FAD binding domain
VRLLQLGANILCEPGYGDDGTPNGGVFADLDLWIREFLLATLHKLGKSRIDRPVLSPSISRSYRVTVLDPPSTTSDDSKEEWQLDTYADYYRAFFERLCPMTAYGYDEKTLRRLDASGRCAPLVGHVRINQRMTMSDWEQDTRHIRIDVSHSDGLTDAPTYTWDLESLPYQAGDVSSILPSNASEEVQHFLNVLPVALRESADRSMAIEYDGSAGDFIGFGCSFWPQHCTLRGWLTYCADIHALPEREDLRALSFFCSAEHSFGQDQRDKLLSLSEATGALYADYVLREKRSWTDVLYDFDSLRASGSKLTVESLLDLLSPLRAREFSIAPNSFRKCRLTNRRMLALVSSYVSLSSRELRHLGDLITVCARTFSRSCRTTTSSSVRWCDYGFDQGLSEGFLWN